MNQGRFSILLKKKLLHFNGGLFASARALPVTGTQLGLLRKAASLEWRHVEPAIFGTLLERALSPDERHKLGAHYTPRAYVERLVLPTVIEPLRDEWSATRIAAVTLAQRGDLKAARAEVSRFHAELCAIRVLDPACGSGNFLYVALEQMKRLEGEVIALLSDFGETDVLNLAGVTVDPHQFLGLELNPRAAAIAELVLWIGYLQWHYRVHGETQPAEPVLRRFHNIENRDAVLAYDKHEFAKDAVGKTIFVWDRRSYKIDPVTGREVPDEKRVRPLDTYVNPRAATWPAADFIIGNPPFLGTSRMREDLGDGYTETLRAAYPDMPESADFVMFWWHKAALATLAGRTRRFGFITTNSIRQTFNRRVVQAAMDDGLYLTFAIPDHPWIDATECAAVRIAMTVGARRPDVGASLADARLQRVTQETPNEETGENEVQLDLALGKVSADLTGGAEVSGTVELQSNSDLSSPGVKLHGSGFIVTPDEAKALGLGKVGGLENHIIPYRNGRDLADKPRGVLVIDLHGLSAESVREKFPKVYEHVLKKVKPERDQNNEAYRRENWWLFGRKNTDLRGFLAGLHRYISTGETAKHRIFQFLDGSIRPDNMLVNFGLDDAFHLGVLSSRIHAVYALAAGGRLGVGNDPRYNKTRCFDPFPFPECAAGQKARIRALAEEIDAHRKRAQHQHGLGLTDIYNVLEKVRASHPLTSKDKALHDAALVSTLKQLHDDLDAAVAAAYGWPWPLADAEILERVVTLNTARAAEESTGLIRWLRPDYQNSEARSQKSGGKQATLILTDEKPAAAANRKSAIKNLKSPKPTWPKTMAERAKAVESYLSAAESPVTPAEVARAFQRANPTEVAEILETLAALSRARPGDTPGTFVR
jgi:hypothetical protein